MISADNVNFQELCFMRSTLWLEELSGIVTGGVRLLYESASVACLFPDARTRRSRPINQRALAPDGVFSRCFCS